MTRILLAAIFVVVMTVAASAERRVALVFGVDKYKTMRVLDNAVNDAQTIDKTLSGLGFEVTLEPNRDLKHMRRALDDFRTDAAGADVALVFFAGHGVEIAGDNRLLPVDADGKSLDVLHSSTLPLEEVRETVAAVGKIGLIILDACRSDPFGVDPSTGRGVTVLAPDVIAKAKPGLGRMGRAENILFAFSAAPGETAADGDSGDSPFTAALAKYLASDGLDIRSVLTLVQQDVYDATRGQQLPYMESGLPKFFFASTTATTLPERERLLLAMADVTDKLRQEVELIAAKNDMPLAPLYGALLDAKLVSLSNEDRSRKLTEAALAYRDAEAKLKTLSSTDPEVTRLRKEAQARLALGAFGEARAKLAEAVGIDARSGSALAANLVARRISEAETHVSDANVARAELDHQGAIEALEKAAALYELIEKEEVSDGVRRERSWVLAGIGDLHILVGNTAAALAAYERMRHAAEVRLMKNPDWPDAQRDLSVSFNEIGYVRRTQGDLKAALEAFEAALDIAKKLAASDPGNSVRQRDLYVGHLYIGSVLKTQGNLPAAQESYEAALTITKKLAARYPGDAFRESDLAESYNQIGGILQARGDLEAARDAYEAALAIRKKLVASNPGDAMRQRDLSISNGKMGDVLRWQGDLQAAREAYEAALAIEKKLVTNDPGNANWRDDLSISYEKLGDVLQAQGNLQAELEAYETALAIKKALAASDPDNVRWQRGLSINHNKVGGVLEAQGNLQAALEAYETALAIREKLAARDRDNAQRQEDLSYSRQRVNAARDALAATKSQP